jgi:hypothetical protein
VEGKQFWDLLCRCENQLRMNNMFIVGIDAVAVFKTAEALGYDLLATAEFLPACERAMVSAINEKIVADMPNKGE